MDGGVTPDHPLYEKRKAASKHQGDWRKEAREAYEFRDGSQWDDEDKAELERQNRPCVTFNRIAPIIDSVTGYEINNRREVKYIPRTIEDRAANSIFTDAAQWVRDNCDAEDEESDAFTDTITCGMGFIETRVDYTEDPDGQIIVERVPPMEMRWDPTARKHNLADANWFMREKWMDIEEVKAIWGVDVAASFDEMPESHDEHDASDAWKYKDDQNWYDKTEGKVLVIHHQWREREHYYRIGDPESGRTLDFSESKFKRLKDELEARGIPYVKLPRWKYMQEIVCGSEELEAPKPAPIDDAFSWSVITGKRDEEEGIFYGMIRAMKDPQRWANAFYSQAMYTIQANSKGGVVVEEGAIGDKAEFEDKWADPAGVVIVEDGAISGGRMKDKPQGQYPSGMDRLMQLAITAIRDCSGVNLELLGMVGHEQTGVLEVERKKSALTILAPMINSLKRYRKIQGRALLSFMRRYIPPGTVMRLTNRAVPFYADDGVVKYDIIVDDAPTSPNLKQEVWATMQNIVPAMVKAGVPMPPDLIKFSPLPDTVADAWVEYVNQQQQMPDVQGLQAQMEQMGQELQKLQQENMGLKDKRQAQMMQIQFKEQEAALNARIREQEMALEQRQHEQELLFKRQMSDADRQAKLMEIQARYETEMTRIQAQAQVQMETSTMQANNAKEIQVISLENEREKRRVAQQEQVNPHIEKIDETASKVDALIDNLKADRERREQNIKMVTAYLESRGGEAAEIARKLH